MGVLVAHIVATLVAQCSARTRNCSCDTPAQRDTFSDPNFGATPPGTVGGGATPKFLGGVARHRCYTCKTL